jgi:hypothetical protein
MAEDIRSGWTLEEAYRGRIHGAEPRETYFVKTRFVFG